MTDTPKTAATPNPCAVCRPYPHRGYQMVVDKGVEREVPCFGCNRAEWERVVLRIEERCENAELQTEVGAIRASSLPETAAPRSLDELAEIAKAHDAQFGDRVTFVRRLVRLGFDTAWLGGSSPRNSEWFAKQADEVLRDFARRASTPAPQTGDVELDADLDALNAMRHPAPQPEGPTAIQASDKLIERICRAVCKVEGLDPDEMTFDCAVPPVPNGPNWTRYAEAVELAIEAAPSPQEPSKEKL